MKTLYLHIGTPKTGTTATQFFLNQNKEALAAHGIWFGLMPYHYPEARQLRNAHFLVGSIYDDEGNEIDRTPRVLEGLELVKTHFRDFDKVLLSDEGIWNARAERKKKLISLLGDFCQNNDIELKIIVYLRSQAEFAESLYKQRVKEFSQRLEPWDEFAKRAHKVFKLDYYKSVKKLEDWVGSGNVIVRKYDRAHFYKDMVQADFLQTIGVEMDDSFVLADEDEEKNISLDNNTTEIKRILNTLQEKVVYNSDESWYFRRAVTAVMLTREADRTSLFSDQEYEQFQQQFAEGNLKLAQEYFGETEPVFMRRSRHMEKWDPKNEEMYYDLIKTFGALCWETKSEMMEVMEQNKKLQKQLDRFERDLGSVREMLRKLHNIKSIFKKG